MSLGLEAANLAVEGQKIKAAGTLPKDAEFFKDHFPRFPILPGVLMLEVLKKAAENALKKKLSIDAVKNVKFAAFLRPGDAWEAELELSGGPAKWECRGKLFQSGKAAASALFSLRLA